MSVGGFVGRLFLRRVKMRVLTDLEPKNVFRFLRIYAVFLIHHTRKRKSVIIWWSLQRQEALSITRMSFTM